MSSYFNPLSWTRAQKNREALEKTNPQNPVFNEDDENFLQKITSQEAAAPPLPDLNPTVITDDGKEEEASETQKEAAELILPQSPKPLEESQEEQESKENKPAETGKQKRTWGSYIPSVPVPSIPSLKSKKTDADSKKDPKPEGEGQEKESEDLSEVAPRPVSSGDAKQAPETESGKSAASEEEKEEDEEKPKEDPTPETKQEPVEEPKEESQEEPKVQDQVEPGDQVKEESKDEIKTETTEESKDEAKDEPLAESEEKPVEQPKEEEAVKELEEIAVEDINKEREGGVPEAAKESTDSSAETSQDTLAKDLETEPEAKADQKTSDAESSEKSGAGKEEGDKTAEAPPRTWASYIPAMPSLGKGSKGKESASDMADAATSSSTHEEDERDVSVLLDRLNLSAINNRVFSISAESQKLLQSFTLILKDMVNGVPTAKDDLETLIKENERHLEQMFGNMPPFVQTLVKSLPSRFAGSLGPEIMAVAGEKPGNDMRARMEAASRPGAAAGPSIANFDVKRKQKEKRKTPGVKDLASEKGAVASMLQNILNFLKVRFPAFVTGTNVLMSLAVFILLFVFYYCHKRGRETRLLKESESARGSADVSEVEDDDEKVGSSSESESEVEPVAVETTDGTVDKDTQKQDDAKTEKMDSADTDDDAASQAQKILEQPAPAEVALPEKKEEPELEGSGVEKA